MSEKLCFKCKKLRAALLILIFSNVWLTTIGNITPTPNLKANPIPENGIPGDVDGNGIVDLEDARLVVRFVVGQIQSLPHPENADANQDGEITIDDGFTIAQRVTGKSRIVIAGPVNGLPGTAQVGTLVRIEVFEKFYPYLVVSGTVRIISQSTGYDSEDQPLTFEKNGRSLYYHWETTGLTPSSDYDISVNIVESGNITPPVNRNNIEYTLILNDPIFEIPQLTQVLDGSAPTPGIPLSFIRTFHSNHEYNLYLGPLGRGWWHSYDIHLVEETNGSVTFLNEIGIGRLFTSNPDGTYTASPGIYAQLFRDPTGYFTLKEKNGIIYRFQSNLLLDHIEDPNGNRITAIYDTNNHLIEVQHSCGTGFQFQYNSFGRITKLTDHINRETTYIYDSVGTHLINVTAPGNRLTSYTYSLGIGDRINHRLLSITFPDTTHQFFSYDSLGRIYTTEGSWGTGKLKYIYDIDGTTHITDSLGNTYSVKANEKSQPTEIIDPLVHTSQYYYDANFNLTDIIYPNGNTNNFTYDVSGNMTKYTDALGNEVNMTYEPTFNKLSSLVDSRGYITTFNYDADGNLILITYPDGSTESFDYEDNGSLLSKTDRNGNMIVYEHDIRGLLLSMEYPDATTADYTYDLAGNLTSASNYTDTITFTYDSIDRLSTVIYPGNRMFQYQYNHTDKRTKMIDPDGRVLSYIYDGAGRLFQITDGLGEVIVEYWYDIANRRAGKGLANGIYTTYTYDAAGQILDIKNFNKTNSLISYFYYTYDSTGNRLSKESVDGIETYAYDELNQLTNVIYPDGTTEQFIYDEMGNRTSVLENGVPTNYAVNNLNQYDSVGAAIYQYDNNGNLISKTENNQTTLYIYDFENRLISVQTPTDTINYSYSPFSLRNSQTSNGEYTKFLWDGDQVSIEENSANQTLACYTWGQLLDEAVRMERNNNNYYFAQDVLHSTSDIFNPDGMLVEHYSYQAFGEPLVESNIGNHWYFTGLSYDFKANLQYNRFRFYSSSNGRFINSDPFGLYGGINLYSYASNNPLSYVDPYGTVVTGGLAIGVWILLGVHIIHWFAGVVQTGYSYSPHDAPGGHGPPNPGSGNSGQPAPSSGGGGICPTFIQVSDQTIPYFSDSLDISKIKESILCKIEVPFNNCLLRSDIPIFGIAGGEDFSYYRVEYGKGNKPEQWYLIDSSNIPKDKNEIGIAQISYMQGDIDLRGNLATWNVGLKNWVHLPWHPPEYQTNLNGIYTIHLVVEGEDGRKVEDQVTCEVGRVIGQCLPGIAISPDEKVTMRFPEQALTHPFRIYTILTMEETGEVKPLPPENAEYIGNVYRIREPGDRFIKDVTLEFSVKKDELSGREHENTGIVQYDVNNKIWIWLPTHFTFSGKEGIFSTELSELPKPKAIYALVYDLENNKRSENKSEKSTKSIVFEPISQEVLVNNTFEEGFGSWKPRDRYVGAILIRDNKTTPDSSYSLKITNDFQGGNFSVTTIDQSFDARDYPLMSFDYRVAQGVKTDFYLLVNNRWYNIGFTDDPVDFRNQDVNIANLSRFENVFTDNNWHSVSINLYELLRRKTKHTQVDAIIMADWDVGGYMKLDFGNNARGATYYIDNFKLSAGPEYDMPDVLFIDNFNTNQSTNMLGGANGTFSNAGTNYLQAIIEKNNDAQNPKDSKTGNNSVLKLTFDASQENAYCGYWTSLQAVDLTDMNEISFQIHPFSDIPHMLIGLRHAKQTVESAVPIQSYITEPDAQGWYTVTIPLSAFIGYGLPDLTCMDVLFIKFENRIFSGKGTVFIDDIRFIKKSNYVVVSDFNNVSAEKNQFGGDYRIIENGAVAISTRLFDDKSNSEETDENTLRISYGGTIGLSYGGRNFSYAIWETDLLGFDASDHKNLVLKIKGQKGGELPNIYLADGATRRCIRAKELPVISTSWQEIRLPLQKYVDQGIDLTHLETLQITFEWEEMSGTIYIDEIYFED